ncbi:MAG: UvrD-helicase domain-containing protein [Betaproteobacteria bacterium]|nr:UvrD-helicase domain-containing protein [Betaproteobacteria bacterium]
MSDFLSRLNDPQRAAVTLPAVHALVLAGAGSGKTRVLITRIAWLIATGQCSPHNVLAVTFTNKAAKEMQARLATLVPVNTRSMWIGTFHGLCNRLLRAHHREAGLPAQFQILDAADQLAAVKRLLKNLNIDSERFPPRELCYFINAHKEEGIRAAQAEAFDDHTRRRVALYAEYEAQCRREGVADFAELLLSSYELLSRNEPLRRHYRERFRHILVDEFQDTNLLQYRWLKLLAAAPENGADAGGAKLFAVGDDDQSIYAFRGAKVGNMRDFEREFRVENVIRLEQNYRSHGNILDAANAIIKNNRDRLGKNLWTDTGAGEPVRVIEAFSDADEARMIVEEAQMLMNGGPEEGEAPLAPDQIALLYRSNAQSRILEHQLFSAGIPYRVYGGLRFFERQEIKHALAYLRLLTNPDDDTAFLRIVNFPTRGIGMRTVENLQAGAAQTHSSLYNAAAGEGRGGGRSAASLAAFVRMIEEMRKQTQNLPLPQIVAHVLAASGLRAHYLAEKEGQERLENLDELENAASNFVSESGWIEDEAQAAAETSGISALTQFLTHAALEAGDHQAGEGQAALQLMTVHAAKGLEFDAVFVTGLEQGLFPHENSVTERDGLEEERRLMYVAMTRARRRLYLSWAQTRLLHGQTRYNLPSLFIEEIPAALLSTLNTISLKPRPDREETFRPSAKGREGNATGALPQGLRIGQNVSHPKFGQGVIVAAEGSGTESRVQVNFGSRAGTKWLALEYAKLTPL